jgi:hypothetical protein
MTRTTEKTFTRQLFLTPAVTTDLYKQHATACPLLPAATIRRVLLANSAINFIYHSPSVYGRKAESRTAV